MKDKDAQLMMEALQKQKVNEADYYEDDNSTDTYLQWKLAEDRWHEKLADLEPLDELAARYGGEDINPAGGNIKGGNIIDWLAKQINQPGSDFVGYFEQQLMKEQ